MRYTLLNRSVIRITGKDAIKFLQGLVTNDLDSLNDNMIYCFLLTPQGKYFADIFILQESEGSLLIDVASVRLNEIISKLMMHKLRSDVSIANLSHEYQVLACDVINNDMKQYPHSKDPRHNEMGYRVYIQTTSDYTIDHGKPQYPYEQKRIRLLLPEGHADMIPDKSFPLEYGIDKFNAFSFDKGCYIGQEVVARIHNRGVIRKQIYRVIAACDTLPPLGTDIRHKDAKIGMMCSSVSNEGLALMKIEDVEALSPEDTLFAENIVLKLA